MGKVKYNPLKWHPEKLSTLSKTANQNQYCILKVRVGEGVVKIRAVIRDLKDAGEWVVLIILLFNSPSGSQKMTIDTVCSIKS